MTTTATWDGDHGTYRADCHPHAFPAYHDHVLCCRVCWRELDLGSVVTISDPPPRGSGHPPRTENDIDSSAPAGYYDDHFKEAT